VNRVEPTAFSATPPQLIVGGQFVVCTHPRFGFRASLTKKPDADSVQRLCLPLLPEG
jgi:hypothetical protein